MPVTTNQNSETLNIYTLGSNSNFNFDTINTTDHSNSLTPDKFEKILKNSLKIQEGEDEDPFKIFCQKYYGDEWQTKYNNQSIKNRFYSDCYSLICESQNLPSDTWLDPFTGLNIYDDRPFNIRNVVELKDPETGLPVIKNGKKVYVEQPIASGSSLGNDITGKITTKILPYSKERFIQECAMKLFVEYNSNEKYNHKTKDSLAKISIEKAKILANEMKL